MSRRIFLVYGLLFLITQIIKSAAPSVAFDVLPATVSRLSQTGLYENIVTKKIAPANIDYSVRFALYSDKLQKVRYVYIPDGQSITSLGNKYGWSFPVGTKIWKEFGYNTSAGRQLVETRYLEKTNKGWAFATYVWNKEQTEAYFWNGDNSAPIVSLELPSYGKHNIPSFSQCLLCHHQMASTPGGTVPEPILGFTGLQLPQALQARLRAENKLVAPEIPPPLYAVFARNGIERQVIGYIHANCGHCHNANRPDIPSGQRFFLNYDVENVTSTNNVNLLRQINRTYANEGVPWPMGGVNAALIKPAQPERSMLYFRMKSAPQGFHMPHIGTLTTDTNFIDNTLREWITNLPAH